MPLSQALAYNVEHLDTAAQHWNRVAAHRESTFADVRNRAQSIDWTGAGADAMREHIERDYRKAVFSADDLREAARIAQSGAGDLDYLHRRLLYNAEDVQNDGFVVGEDYTATDIRPSNSVIEQAQRARQAVEHTADLKLKARDLTEADARVGARLTQATAGEGKVQFTDFAQDGPAAPNNPRDHKPHITAIDHHWKQGPDQPLPGPPGNPFAGWTEAQKQQVAAEIAHGHVLEDHPGSFPKEWTERDIARWIYDTMNDPTTRVATSTDSGGTALLRDGKVIFINPKDGHYGTAFRPEPRPGDKWLTPDEYFRQQTKPIERLPPPNPARFPPLSPEDIAPPTAGPQPKLGPAPHPAAPPADSPPPLDEGPKLPVGGAIDPWSPASGPHPVYPPGHHHHQPVLAGEDPEEVP